MCVLHVCYMKFGIITINIIIIVVSFGFGKRSVTGARTTLRAINTGRFMQAELLTAPPPPPPGEITKSLGNIYSQDVPTGRPYWTSWDVPI